MFSRYETLRNRRLLRVFVSIEWRKHRSISIGRLLAHVVYRVVLGANQIQEKGVSQNEFASNDRSNEYIGEKAGVAKVLK